MRTEGGEGSLEWLKASQKLSVPNSFDISCRIDSALVEGQMSGLPECIFGDLTDIEYSDGGDGDDNDNDEVDGVAIRTSHGDRVDRLAQQGSSEVGKATLDRQESVTVSRPLQRFGLG